MSFLFWSEDWQLVASNEAGHQLVGCKEVSNQLPPLSSVTTTYYAHQQTYSGVPSFTDVLVPVPSRYYLPIKPQIIVNP